MFFDFYFALNQQRREIITDQTGFARQALTFGIFHLDKGDELQRHLSSLLVGLI